MTREEIIRRIEQLDEVGLKAVEEVLSRRALVGRQLKLIDQLSAGWTPEESKAFDEGVARRPWRSESLTPDTDDS